MEGWTPDEIIGLVIIVIIFGGGFIVKAIRAYKGND